MAEKPLTTGEPPRHVRRVRIFVSSPRDVAEERRVAKGVVHRLGLDPAVRAALSLDPILWDDPEAPAPMLATRTPQESVNENLVRPSDCEIVVTIFWSRMGTPLETPLKQDGSQYLSGTEWEFEDACRDANETGRKVLLYGCTKEPQVSLKDPDIEEKKRQLGLVERFFAGVRDSGRAYSSYDSPADFERRLEHDLRASFRVIGQVVDERVQEQERARGDGSLISENSEL